MAENALNNFCQTVLNRKLTFQLIAENALNDLCQIVLNRKLTFQLIAENALNNFCQIVLHRKLIFQLMVENALNDLCQTVFWRITTFCQNQLRQQFRFYSLTELDLESHTCSVSQQDTLFYFP